MKRCPKCSRTYPDENQKFCTIDGGLLLAEQPNFDPNLTVRATSKELTPPPAISSEFSEAPTSMQLPSMEETITSFGTTAPSAPANTPTAADLRAPGQAAPTSADLRPPGRSATTSGNLKYPVQVAPTSTDLSAATIALGARPGSADPPAQAPVSPPITTPVAPAKKKSMLPLIIGIVVILLILIGGGAAAAGYFLWLKPRMEANRRPVPTVVEPTNENANSNTNTNANTNSNTTNVNSSANTNAAEAPKKEPDPFVPAAGDVQFANSKATLDGELADHYVGFSFYYPQTWTKDPKAGVPGATSFATVAREFNEKTADYIQERALISWYPSNGTYEADLPIFPERAKKVTDQISKGLPGYEEVSRGETTVNGYKGYEFRFKGTFKNTGKGDLPYWGRVIFLPTGNADEKNGVTIVMLATSLAPDVTGAGDVGVKGELPLILESFRFGANR